MLMKWFLVLLFVREPRQASFNETIKRSSAERVKERSQENEGIMDNPKTMTASIYPIIYYYLCFAPWFSWTSSTSPSLLRPPRSWLIGTTRNFFHILYLRSFVWLLHKQKPFLRPLLNELWLQRQSDNCHFLCSHCLWRACAIPCDKDRHVMRFVGGLLGRLLERWIVCYVEAICELCHSSFCYLLFSSNSKCCTK